MAETIPEAEALRETTMDLRDRYTSSRVSDSDADYQRLIRMRQTQVNSWGSAKVEVDRQMADILLGERTSQRLREVGFTWIDESRSPLPGVDRMEDAFKEAEWQTRTYSYESDTLEHHADITVARDGVLERIACRFGIPLEPDSQTCHIHFTAPGDRRAVYSFSYLRESFEFSTDHSFLREKLREEGFYERIPAGDWRIALGCDGNVWTPRPEETWCHITLGYQAP